jgi:hypothetical protein
MNSLLPYAYDSIPLLKGMESMYVDLANGEVREEDYSWVFQA